MLGADWKQFDETFIDLIPNEVIINFYVFGSFVKYSIGGNMYSSLIVTKYESRCRGRNLKITK